jgi:hypothetical protein
MLVRPVYEENFIVYMCNMRGSAGVLVLSVRDDHDWGSLVIFV